MEKLQKQIQAVAKKTGISSAAKLALVAKKEDFESKYIPTIEWWDMALLPNHKYTDLDRELGEDEELFAGITSLIEHPIAKDAPSKWNENNIFFFVRIFVLLWYLMDR